MIVDGLRRLLRRDDAAPALAHPLTGDETFEARHRRRLHDADERERRETHDRLLRLQAEIKLRSDLRGARDEGDE